MAFFMLIRYIMLWPWPLTRRPWKFMVHQVSRDQSMYEIWAKSSNRQLNYWQFLEFLHTLWQALTLTCDFLILNFYCTLCHAFKPCPKFEQNWIIHSWAIGDLARFCRAILGDGALLPNGYRVRGPNFTKLGTSIGQSFLYKNFVSDFRYLVIFSNAGGSKFSDVLNDAKFCTFWLRPPLPPPPPPEKIRGGVGEISIATVEALPMTEPHKYIWWPSTAWLLSTVDW